MSTQWLVWPKMNAEERQTNASTRKFSALGRDNGVDPKLTSRSLCFFHEKTQSSLDSVEWTPKAHYI